jgi:hypothetical protein
MICTFQVLGHSDQENRMGEACSLGGRYDECT